MPILKRKYYPHAITLNSHVFGLFGYLSPFKTLFLLVTPFNLLLSFILLVYYQTEKNKAFWLFTFIIFACGYFLEVIGVHTKLIFGDYSYGSTLGISFLNVPLVMGLNWLNLIYAIGIVLNKLSLPNWIKSLIGASLLVLLDYFIEPVAMKYDFWDWKNGQIPLQNFVAWFIISFVFLLYFYKAKFAKKNQLALIYLISQFVFFVFLCYF